MVAEAAYANGELEREIVRLVKDFDSLPDLRGLAKACAA